MINSRQERPNHHNTSITAAAITSRQSRVRSFVSSSSYLNVQEKKEVEQDEKSNPLFIRRTNQRNRNRCMRWVHEWIMNLFFPSRSCTQSERLFLQVYYELLCALCFSCLFTFTSPLLWSSMRDETSKYYFIMHTHTTKSTKCTRCTISWILTKNTIDWVNVWIYL